MPVWKFKTFREIRNEKRRAATHGHFIKFQFELVFVRVYYFIFYFLALVSVNALSENKITVSEEEKGLK